MYVNPAWPANRNDILIAKASIILPTPATGITTPTDAVTAHTRRDPPPNDDQTALAAHNKLRARIEHVLARTKD